MGKLFDGANDDSSASPRKSSQRAKDSFYLGDRYIYSLILLSKST